MNSMFSRLGFLAVASTLAALAGCNAVEDVRSEPFIDLPPDTVVLQGTVTGLGSQRQLGLINNGNDSDGLGVAAPVPAPTAVGTFPVVFTFGSRAVKDANGNPVPYNIQIKDQPYGKTCAFRAGTQNSGILSTESPPNIVIDCTPTPGIPLYDVTVILDSAFANAAGAKVRLTTEDGIFEQAVTAANIASGTMTFDDKLFNASSAVANGPIPTPAPPAGSPLFVWSVGASTTVGGSLNKCPVLRPSNPTVSGALQNPSANIAGAGVAPQVQACSFTISGRAHYSRPAGVAADSPLGAGLTLDLLNLNGVRKGTATVAAGAFPVATPPAQGGAGINFTFTNVETSTTAFTSNAEADFQVVVTSHPAGQTCIVPDGGYVSLKSFVSLNPVNVTGTGVTAGGAVPAAGPANPAPAATVNNTPVSGTRLIVACRNRPTAANTLNGIYRLTKTVAQILTTTNTPAATPAVTNSSRTATSTWRPFDLTVQNNASNNIIAFFDDGTFLYGTHLSSVQVEYGFYDYSATLSADDFAPAPTANPGRLRLTLLTDTFFNTVFPGTFDNVEITSFVTANPATTPGASALPGALTYFGLDTRATVNSGTPPAPIPNPTLNQFVIPVVNAPLPFRHVNLGNVVKTAAAGSTPAMITATAGPYGGNSTNFSSPTFTAAAPIGFPATPAAPTAPATSSSASVASSVNLEFTEVSSINNQMTGGWVSQDRRRVWVWDKSTTYGNHIGVNGLTNLESACFTVENPSGQSGNFQRRSGQTGCYPINRPRQLPTPQAFASIGMEAQDVGYLLTTHASTTTGGAPGAPTGAFATGNVVSGTYSTANLAARFPQYESRIPGGQSALDGRYVSPVYYHVAPALTFFASASTLYFPVPAAPLSSWCTTDILGLRSTVNDVPFREVVYFCRQRAQ